MLADPFIWRFYCFFQPGRFKKDFERKGFLKRAEAFLNKQEKLEQTPEKKGQIENPYKPAQFLELDDSLFVGRHDLVRQLEVALGKGNHRQIFFLNGERQMGKSSMLKQLPSLLGARYLPIVLPLQNRAISSSTSALLGGIAEEIYKVMNFGGMPVRTLVHMSLREASEESDAAAYYIFDEWFRELEQTLEQNDRTLLLIFDDFEELEKARQEGDLNLKLLLDWFRSTIQNRHRVTLLFSGVHTLGEMGIETGINWAGYFVNVETLRVSFLRVNEVRQLITKPIPDFPSEQIFGAGVVEEIIQVTGCHPFLVESVCSVLIENLNIEKRGRAEIQDVRVAMIQVLESRWSTYFRDLWERSNQEQRACLINVNNLGNGDLQQIAQQSKMEESITYRILQTLLRRGLVLREQGSYRIVAPIFSEWVERIADLY